MSASVRTSVREVPPLAVENHLLAALPAEDYQYLLPRLELVHLKFNEVIYESGEPLEYVYFPQNAVASMLAVLEDGTTVEVAMLGKLDMVGGSAILDAHKAMYWTVVQVAGKAMRMRTSELKELFPRVELLQRVLTQSYRSLITQISQRAVCNCRHMVMQRLCTWLLMMHDRVGSNHLPLTQDLMARRLGLRRASVTMAANNLQSMGIINHGRGYTAILERQQMESLACECYAIISAEANAIL